MSGKEITGSPQWVSLLWSQDRSTLSARGTIPSGPYTNLYALLRVVYDKGDAANELPNSGEHLEKEIRAFAVTDSR